MTTYPASYKFDHTLFYMLYDLLNRDQKIKELLLTPKKLNLNYQLSDYDISIIKRLDNKIEYKIKDTKTLQELSGVILQSVYRKDSNLMFTVSYTNCNGTTSTFEFHEKEYKFNCKDKNLAIFIYQLYQNSVKLGK